jgi:hypothetical protein
MSPCNPYRQAFCTKAEPGSKGCPSIILCPKAVVCGQIEICGDGYLDFLCSWIDLR